MFRKDQFITEQEHAALRAPPEPRVVGLDLGLLPIFPRRRRTWRKDHVAPCRTAPAASGHWPPPLGRARGRAGKDRAAPSGDRAQGSTQIPSACSSRLGWGQERPPLSAQKPSSHCPKHSYRPLPPPRSPLHPRRYWEVTRPSQGSWRSRPGHLQPLMPRSSYVQTPLVALGCLQPRVLGELAEDCGDFPRAKQRTVFRPRRRLVVYQYSKSKRYER